MSLCPGLSVQTMKGNTMIKSILAAGCSLVAMVLVPFAGMALTPIPARAEVVTLEEWAYGPETFEAPKLSCEEDEPCWRVWLGNGKFSPEAPLYMYLPEGPSFDALAPLFGYEVEV